MNKNKILNIEQKKFIYLKLFQFHKILLWDVKRYSKVQIESQYPVEKLSYHVKEENKRILPYEYPEEKFKILGVNNKIGLFDAYEEFGKNIKQPYKKVENGFLAYNPYRVNVGSIGLKTNKQKNEYISPAYVVFSCKDTLLPEYLYIILKTEKYNSIIKESTTGSVRQNLTFESLKNFDTPVPSLEIQEKLISNYYKQIKIVEEQENKIKKCQGDIENYIVKELGVIIKNINFTKGINNIYFSNIDRWAVDYLKNQIDLKCKYPLIKTKEFIRFAQYGLSLKASKEKKEIPILRMNNIYEGNLILNNLKYIDLDSKKKKNIILDKGDLLFNRTNSKELVGKTAVFNEDGIYTFASYLIRLKLDSSKVDVNYLNFLFNSIIGRSQINLISRQILGQANVNLDELGDFVFPIPDIKIQKRIVSHLLKIVEQRKYLIKTAYDNKQIAIKDFEKEVLK